MKAGSACRAAEGRPLSASAGDRLSLLTRVLAAATLCMLSACSSTRPVTITLISQTNTNTVNTGFLGDRVLKPSERSNIIAFYDGNERYEAFAPYADSEGHPLEECASYTAQLRRNPERVPFVTPYRVTSLTRIVPDTNGSPAEVSTNGVQGRSGVAHKARTAPKEKQAKPSP